MPRAVRLAVAALLLAVLPTPAVLSAEATQDALHDRVLGELDTFVAWLDAHGVRGFVGEIGWPDDHGGDADEWNALAEAWYERADAAGLSAMVWATGEWWPPEYPLAAYEDADHPNSDGVDTANTQAPVIEAHLGAGVLRGIDVATGTFCEPDHGANRSDWFSNRMEDRYGTCYRYDGADTFEYLASRGIELVKIEFRWEIVQSRLGQRLDRRDIARLAAAVARARAAGLEVMLSMHNFGAYFLWNGKVGVRRTVGSKELPARYLVDVWRRLSARFGADPGVQYAIMCEPVRMKPRGDRSPAEVWEQASQRVVSALRANGDGSLIAVSGYRWSALAGWPERHPEPWIADPADNVVYEAHHYWDRDASGTYAHGYADEVAWAGEPG